ncbi:MAG: hypothetical protein ACOC7U_09170 [Spirochaetota bacterium]
MLKYTQESTRPAKQKGLYTNYVTNGYMIPRALDALGPFLDVYRFAIKGSG